MEKMWSGTKVNGVLVVGAVKWGSASAAGQGKESVVEGKVG